MAKGKTRCGFIALLGAPNAGKSTLLNAMTGSKLSIVSPKPQTTRARVTGICVQGQSQLVFLDLPGVFTPKRKLDKAMVETAWEGAGSADLVLVLVDAARKSLASETRTILNNLKAQKRKAVLVLNKVDAVAKPRLLELTKELTADEVFTDVLMVSAATGDGIKDLLKFVAGKVPEGPWHYPEDQLTDMPERLWAAEITREQLFLQLKQELPYQVTVETESWEDRKGKLTAIAQAIYVQRENQRAIVLGAGGARIKTIGIQARAEMEKELERKVHLTLHVKVKENWSDDTAFLRQQGLLGQG